MQIETANAADIGREPREVETELRPATPLACSEQNLVPLDFDNCRVRLAIAMNEEVHLHGLRILEKIVFRPDKLGFGGFRLEGKPGALAAAFFHSFGRGVLGKMLIGAIGAQHVGRAHAGDAAVVAVLRGAGRIVGG